MNHEDIEKIKKTLKPEQLEMLARMLKDGKMPTINRTMKRKQEQHERKGKKLPINRTTKQKDRLKALLEERKASKQASITNETTIKHKGSRV
jgi:hypothetical protein